MAKTDLSGRSVLVMGLGLHGGGLATVRYLVNRGASCTVTDLRSEADLRPSLDGLPGSVRAVLGRHEKRDFERADLVIKNPAVPRTVPILQHARAITTDIALFLAERGPEAPLVAITGTKGKSTTAGATARALQYHPAGVRLGGNITISPLTFLDDLGNRSIVVLELSSFQLGDLRFCREFNSRRIHDAPPVDPGILSPILRPHVAVITSIFRDHQDYYGSMDTYVADKKWIVHDMPPDSICVFGDDTWGRIFTDEAREHGVPTERIVPVGTEVPPGRGPALPERLTLTGSHMRHNLAMAAVAATHCGAASEDIAATLTSFSGVPHRMEVLGRNGSLTFVNDTAATIPEASLAAVESYATSQPGARIVLIAGGTDKDLDLTPLIEAIRRVISDGGAVVLLEGTATTRLLELAPEIRRNIEGPYSVFTAAVERAIGLATNPTERDSENHDTPTIMILSPGCASFGMFQNEFDRGEQFSVLLRPHLAE